MEHKSIDHALAEMRNVSANKHLGNWTDSQRAIIGVWATWVEKDVSKIDAEPASVVEGPRKKGKIEAFIDNTMAALILGFAGFFFIQGGMYYYQQRQPAQVVRSVDKEVTCYGSREGMNCLLNWFIDLKIDDKDE